MTVPYEFIGRITVTVLTLVVGFSAGCVLYYFIKALWHRVLTEIINLMWWGYSFDGEHPPEWRRKISIIVHTLRNGDWEKMQEKLKNIEKYNNDN